MASKMAAMQKAHFGFCSYFLLYFWFVCTLLTSYALKFVSVVDLQQYSTFATYGLKMGNKMAAMVHHFNVSTCPFLMFFFQEMDKTHILQCVVIIYERNIISFYPKSALVPFLNISEWQLTLKVKVQGQKVKFYILSILHYTIRKF